MIVASTADHEGVVAGVPRVDESSKAFIVLKEGISFVQQQGRPPFLDGSEKRARCDVACLQWASAEFGHDDTHLSFTASFFRGGDDS